MVTLATRRIVPRTPIRAALAADDSRSVHPFVYCPGTTLGSGGAARGWRSQLRTSGVNRFPAQRRGRPDYGWPSLSESELQVVGLVAEGLTNREVGERLFMSRHTVDSHLRHVFVKLGVPSQVALTRLFLDQLEGASCRTDSR